MDNGPCTEDADCEQWFGKGFVCRDDALCAGESFADDEDDDSQDGDGTDDDDDDLTDGDGTDDDDDDDDDLTDGDGTNDDDDDLTDGDGTDGDEECPNFSGVYAGTDTCRETGEYLAWVYVDAVCRITLDSDFGHLTGLVDEDGGIIIGGNGGGPCLGSGEGDGSLSLTCETCIITLTPQPVTAGNGHLDVSPTELDFGVMNLGDTGTRSLTIGNSGAGALQIDRIVMAAGTTDDFRFANLGDWDIPAILSPGSEQDLAVNIEVVNNGPRQGWVVLFSDDPERPILTVPLLSRRPAEPRIELDPASIDFGLVSAGEMEQAFFRIRSVGDAAATVTAVTLGSDCNGAFSLVNGGPSVPFSLERPYETAVEVAFSPLEGVHEAGIIQQSYICVTYLNAYESETDVCLNLSGGVREMLPPCIDVTPQDGRLGIWGLNGEIIPGPGIRWGGIQVGVSSVRTASFRNCGDETLEITSMMWNTVMDSLECSFSGGSRPFYESPGTLHPYSLGRNETVFIDFIFAPRTAGQACAAAVQIQSNAQSVGWTPPPSGNDYISSFHMGVAGTGGNRDIDVLPPRIDFGPVSLECCSRPEPVTVWNVGDLALNVQAVSIAVGGSDNCGMENENCAFSLVDVPPLPYALGGEDANGMANPQSFQFGVTFCPVRLGLHEAIMEITSDDAFHASFIVPVKGEGTNLGHQVDSFQQPSVPKIDMLWVVNCSGSMGEEQSNLATNFSTFINEAVTWNADIQIAVVSMDMEDPDHQGTFQCFLKNRGTGALSNAEMLSQFQACVSLGTSCSGWNKGLEAAHAALSAPLVTGDTVNPGPQDAFLRDEAKLVILWVSDREDRSTGDLDYYTDFFRQIKGASYAEMLEGYAIVGNRDNGCSGNGGDASSSARYIDVADSLNPHANEHFMSICSTSFAPLYQNLSENLFVPRRQFQLSRPVDPNTILVKVNGVTVTGYTYEEASNSIVFNEASPPPTGATIRVEYDTLCLP